VTAEIPYPKALEAFPVLRQSLLSRFDECALSTRFDLEYRQGWSGHEAARGIIFHRFASKAMREMAAQQEETIDVGVALAILLETLRQADVPDSEIVNIPSREIKELVWMVKKFAYESRWDIANLVDIEQRLWWTVRYPNPYGGFVDRDVSGQLDALFVRGEALDQGVVIDYKAQPTDAKVLTPTGWRQIGTLRPGDQVIGSAGKAVDVLGIYPQGTKDVFEVEFVDGGTTRCCDEHLWSVRYSGRRLMTRPLSEIRALKNRVAVPAIAAPVEFDQSAYLPHELPIDPYVLGALLGDGTLTLNGSVRLTSADPEIMEQVAAAVPAGTRLRRESGNRSGAATTWSLTTATGNTEPHVNPLRRSLKALGLLGHTAAHKHIPERYLYGTSDERLALLRGLMDTDGCANVNGRISFGSASRTLSEQVQFLVRSLGGSASIRTFAHEGHLDSHVVFMRLDVPPFTLPRKVERWHPPGQSTDRGVRAIRPAGNTECVCIRVDAADGLYVTDDFILTHNTGWHLPPPSDVSEKGFFQQRFYALLVLRNHTSLQSVTLREFYPRFCEAREATIFRDQLDEIEESISALVERFDRCFETEVWHPSPGKGCSYCPRPTACPIFPTARRSGRITSGEEAELVAAQIMVAEAAIKQNKEALKSWTAEYGPVHIKDSKNPRVIGHRESKRVERPTQAQLEQALELGQPVESLYREVTHTRFDAHIPREPTWDEQDDRLLLLLERSVADAQERSKSDE